MRKLYLIAFDDGMVRNDLISFLETISGSDKWMYSMPHSLFLFSDRDANGLYTMIANRFSGHGRFFVTEVPRRNAQGWIPESHWKIMDDNNTVHSYTLQFDGYWREGRESALPSQSGIYCVYASVYNKDADTVSLRRLLYIGRAVNIHDRHIEHEAKSFWRKQLNSGESLCYSIAPLKKNSLEICEAAMIFKHQPICNDKCKESFPHGATHVETKGCNALLLPSFTVG